MVQLSDVPPTLSASSMRVSAHNVAAPGIALCRCLVQMHIRVIRHDVLVLTLQDEAESQANAASFGPTAATLAEAAAPVTR